MKFEDCKEGMTVRISNNIAQSLKEHGGTMEKKQLIGSFQVIQKVKERNRSVLVNGWHFVPADLNPVDIDIQQNDLKFNSILEVEEGMKIMIGFDISTSCTNHGGTTGKQKLIGTIQTVSKVRPESKSVRIYDKNRRWHFSLCDIRKVIPSIPPREPELFDPEQLVLD